MFRALLLVAAALACRASSVAVCITGSARTFVVPEVHSSVASRLVGALRRQGAENVDVFLDIVTDPIPGAGVALACPRDAEEGGFRKALALLRPREVLLSATSECAVDDAACCPTSHGSKQMSRVVRCFERAVRHGARTGRNYTHFIRARPDMAYWQDVILGDVLTPSDVVTSQKIDAPGSDMFFAFSEEARRLWLEKMEVGCALGCCPEFTIFGNMTRGIRVRQSPQVVGGLVRAENRVACWRVWGQLGAACVDFAVNQLLGYVNGSSRCTVQYGGQPLYSIFKEQTADFLQASG